MEHTNASHLSQVLAVGGRGDVFVAIKEPAGYAAGGAVREGQVVVLHDRSGRVGRGGDEDWHGAEVEEHEGTINSMMVESEAALGDYRLLLMNLNAPTASWSDYDNLKLLWKPMHRSIALLSTTEAEYIATKEGVKEVTWLRDLVMKFGIAQDVVAAGDIVVQKIHTLDFGESSRHCVLLDINCVCHEIDFFTRRN
nr:Retrovirus-related Pol polyprotein from transposon TNT 1-94 [Ipomoea batatas]